MDGLWKMAPDTVLIMCKNNRRTYSCVIGDDRGLMIELKFSPFTEICPLNKSTHLAPLTLVEWSD